MVIWVIGLAGSGKSTISKIIHRSFLKNKMPTVLIDGDEIRKIFANDLGYSIEDRLKNASRIRELCKLLDKNAINVICAILSVSETDRNWCRNNLSSYLEIFIDVSMDMIEKRGYRDLYSRYDKGLIENVVGKDIKFEKPRKSDFILYNDTSKEDFIDQGCKIAKSILQSFK